MRTALRNHNFTQAFRLLRKAGYSQQHIGRLTGHSQPEISAIIHGHRPTAYHVIARITYGLGIPPNYTGTCWCTCNHNPPSQTTPDPT